MDKNDLRKQMKTVRESIDNAHNKNGLITSALIDFLDFNHIVKIFSYVSMRGEVDTFDLIEYYINKDGAEVYVPRTKSGKMELIRLTAVPSCPPDKYGNLADYNGYLSQGRALDPRLTASVPQQSCVVSTFSFKNESAPTYTGKVDAAIVPMLAFNDSCHRLGYGGGYYDKFLSQNSCIKIGVAFDEQYCPDLAEDKWDVPLDMIFTPTKLITR